MKDSVNVLGTEWRIVFKNDEEVCADMNCELGDVGGYCSASGRTIVIANLDKCDSTDDEKAETKRTNLRHKIVHAFLFESGLGFNANASDCWAKNEEMVDWIAIQGPKIYQAWKDSGALRKRKQIEVLDENNNPTGCFIWAEVDE